MYKCQICGTEYPFDGAKVQYGYTSTGGKFSYMRCHKDQGYAYSDAPSIGGGEGSVGPQGPEGPMGPVGPKGDTGATGPQGLKGEKGDIGLAGKDGATGPKGDTGATGATGAAGKDGKSVTGLTLTTDVDGKVTSGTVTFSDSTTAEVAVNNTTV